MTSYRCPDATRCPDDVVGCGHRFEAEPDHEGLVDCPECGIWFDPRVEPSTVLEPTVERFDCDDGTHHFSVVEPNGELSTCVIHDTRESAEAEMHALGVREGGKC